MSTVSDVLDQNMRMRGEIARLRAVVRATREILASSRYHDDLMDAAQVSAHACERARLALDVCDDAGDPR